MTQARRYLSVWFPCLSTDRCLLQYAGLDNNQPLVVMLKDHRGLRIDGMNAAAEAMGLEFQMKQGDARARLPDLVALETDRAADMALLQRLARWLEMFSPWVSVDDMPFGPDIPWHPLGHGLMLEVTGIAHLFGGEDGLLAAVCQTLADAGLQHRVGLADTPGTAWGVARFGNRQMMLVPTGAATTRKALAALPVRALRLAPDDVLCLQRLGLRYIGQLYEMPRANLATRLGNGVMRRLDQALGREREMLDSQPLPEETRFSLSFAEPIGLPDDLHLATEDLCMRLCAALKARQQGVRRLQLVFHRVDGALLRHAIGTSLPCQDSELLNRLFLPCFEQVDPGFGIEAMHLDILMAEQITPEQDSFQALRGDGVRASKELALLVDRIQQRLGEENCYRLVRLPAADPRRSLKRLPPLSAKTVESPVAVPARPVRLLSRREAVDGDVAAGDFHWRRQHHHLKRLHNVERIRHPWWRDLTPDDQTWRDYYRAETESGLRLWLSRAGTRVGDRDPDRIPWQVEGLFG